MDLYVAPQREFADSTKTLQKCNQVCMDSCASFCVATSYDFISLNSLQGEAVQCPRLLINVQDDQKLFTTAIELAFTNDWRLSCTLVSTIGHSTASQPQSLDPPEEAFLVA